MSIKDYVIKFPEGMYFLGVNTPPANKTAARGFSTEGEALVEIASWPTELQRGCMAVPRLHKGFAALPKEQVSAIARKGGQEAHAKGRGHVWSSDQAREAGRKGGLSTRDRRAARSTP